jgi:hypothetical protein
MTKVLSLFAILTLATTLAFSQAADRPATTDRDANAIQAWRPVLLINDVLNRRSGA